MKTKLIILGLCIAVCSLFTACSDDDDNTGGHGAPSRELAQALKAKYPDADNISWKKKGNYDIATFTLSKTRAVETDTVNVWFGSNAQICLVNEEIKFERLPRAVKEGFSKSLYNDIQKWEIDDVYKLERDGVISYKIEIENKLNDDDERDLYYNELGVLIKDEIHKDDDEKPLQIPEKIKTWINQNHKGAIIVDYEYDHEDKEYEIDLLQNSKLTIEITLIEKGDGFTVKEEEYKYQHLNDLPQVIQDKAKAIIEAQTVVAINDIDEIEMKKVNGKEIYTIEFEKNKAEYELQITKHTDGSITAGTIIQD